MTAAMAIVRCCDAVEFLQGVDAGSVDCVVTDPAYESLEKHRTVGTTTRLTNEWFPIFPNARFPALLEQLFRVLRADAHMYMMFDQETARVVTPLAEAVGFRWWKWLIWDKLSPGMGYHYRARHELVGFFEKGKRRLNSLSTPDVLAFKRVRGYPTEKPVGLSTVLIEQSTLPGEWVLDPFCGSGAVGEAALRLGCHFVGVDIQQHAVEQARARLARVQEEQRHATAVDG